MSICGFDYRLKMYRNFQSILVLRNEGYSMREIAKKLKILYNAVYYSLHRTGQAGSNQNRKRSGRPWCTTDQEDMYIWVSSLRNRLLTSPQLAGSLNSIQKTLVSTSTVKRRLQDAGLLGRGIPNLFWYTQRTVIVSDGLLSLLLKQDPSGTLKDIVH